MECRDIYNSSHDMISDDNVIVKSTSDIKTHHIGVENVLLSITGEDSDIEDVDVSSVSVTSDLDECLETTTDLPSTSSQSISSLKVTSNIKGSNKMFQLKQGMLIKKNTSSDQMIRRSARMMKAYQTPEIGSKVQTDMLQINEGEMSDDEVHVEEMEENEEGDMVTKVKEEFKEVKKTNETNDEDEKEICNSSQLCLLFPGRQNQIHYLLSLMGQPSEWVPPVIYIYGHPSTGKTSVVTNLLIKSKVPFVYVDLLECYSSRLLYEIILNKFSGFKYSPTNSNSHYISCDNLSDFVHELQKNVMIPNQTVYIVIDRAERLRDMEPTLLPSVIQLAELSHLNLCVILISTLVWEKFTASTGTKQPLVVYFNQYSKEEVLDILAKDCPPEYSRSFYVTYLTHIWNVLSSITRNIKELRYVATKLFSFYCEPVHSGIATQKETRKLWSYIEPHFKTLITPLLLTDYASEKSLRDRGDTEIIKTTSSSVSIKSPQLPYVVKFLLIAAYLASYNPPKSDQRFFSKRKQKKGKRSMKRQQYKEETKRQLLGPKPFPLERMVAIFYSIMEEEVIPSPLLYSQITTLVTLRYLLRIGTGDMLDVIKYKCLVTFEKIRDIAKSVDFEIVRYLHDYNY